MNDTGRFLDERKMMLVCCCASALILYLGGQGRFDRQVIKTPGGVFHVIVLRIIKLKHMTKTPRDNISSMFITTIFFSVAGLPPNPSKMALAKRWFFSNKEVS
ncbi:hypothetical protein [Escherichia coli]|uniref:hypothetical protein n=1 Tax=Escherichia coli TaxID=562 RepID=UPI00388DEAB0